MHPAAVSNSCVVIKKKCEDKAYHYESLQRSEAVVQRCSVKKVFLPFFTEHL